MRNACPTARPAARVPSFCPALVAALAVAFAMPAQAAEKPIEFDIPAGKIDEICLPIKAGDTIHWRFTADGPVDFNLHHHVGKKVVMPVKQKAITSHEGKLDIKADAEWCLMWTAPKTRGVSVRGGFATTDVLR
jgi:hypothetical protein